MSLVALGSRRAGRGVVLRLRVGPGARRHTIAMVIQGACDLGEADLGPTPEKKAGTKRGLSDDGTPRKFLRVYETAPCQLLNAYGEARFNRLSDQAVWAELRQPLKTGAAWMTDYCSYETERQGIAASRWLQTMVAYCKHIRDEQVRKFQLQIMNAEVLQKVYAEIDAGLCALEYCPAPKKQREKQGASELRAGAVDASQHRDAHSRREIPLLMQNAQVLYDVLLGEKPSKLSEHESALSGVWQALSPGDLA